MRVQKKNTQLKFCLFASSCCIYISAMRNRCAITHIAIAWNADHSENLICRGFGCGLESNTSCSIKQHEWNKNKTAQRNVQCVCVLIRKLRLLMNSNDRVNYYWMGAMHMFIAKKNYRKKSAHTHTSLLPHSDIILHKCNCPRHSDSFAAAVDDDDDESYLFVWLASDWLFFFFLPANNKYSISLDYIASPSATT